MSIGAILAGLLGGILISLALVAGIAYAAFWALYTLTGYYIPYNGWTVLALWVSWFVFSIVVKSVRTAVVDDN